MPKTFIVRMTGGYALKFHANAGGPRYEAVADKEATTFTDEPAAREKAVNHGLRFGKFNVDPVEETHRNPQPAGN